MCFPKSVFYAAKIVSRRNEQGDFGVSYSRKNLSFEELVMPHVPDIASANEPDVAQTPPQPLLMKTKCLSGILIFHLNLEVFMYVKLF